TLPVLASAAALSRSFLCCHFVFVLFLFFVYAPPTVLYPLSLHDALPISVAPIIKIFFGTISSFIESSNNVLRYRFLKATATDRLAEFCAIIYRSRNSNIILGLYFTSIFSTLSFHSYYLIILLHIYSFNHISIYCFVTRS